LSNSDKHLAEICNLTPVQLSHDITMLGVILNLPQSLKSHHHMAIFTNSTLA